MYVASYKRNEVVSLKHKLIISIGYKAQILEMLQLPNTARSYVSRIYIWHVLFVENFPECSNFVTLLDNSHVFTDRYLNFL